MMLFRVIVIVFAAGLIVWWGSPMDPWQMLFTVVFVSAAFLLGSDSSMKGMRTDQKNEKVVSLKQYRTQRAMNLAEQNGNALSGLKSVYESQFLHEAELIASLLESHGIPTHVLNRHNASILIHPMSEMRVKVLVPRVEFTQSQQLIEEYRSAASPEDSSSA